MILPPGQAKILYVDDEIDNLTIFKAAFRKLYDIQVALSGKEALQLMRNRPPGQSFDVLITDQRMPEMTGVELLEIAAREFPQTIRIMLTGYSDMEAIIRAINKGRVFRYLNKPWELDELRITIDEAFLEAKKQRAAAGCNGTPQATESGILAKLQHIVRTTEEAIKSATADAFIFNPNPDRSEKSLAAFYRFTEHKQSLLFTAACQTEDPLKGVVFSLIIRYLLDNAVLNGMRTPAELLAELQLNFCTTSRIIPHVVDTSVGALLINHSDRTISYAGACQELLLIENNKIRTLKGIPQPLGKENTAFSAEDFEVHTRKLPDEPTFMYITTDGLAEHLCGFNPPNFGKQYLAEILEEIHELPAVRQKQLLQSLWNEWQAQQESQLHKPSTDPMLIGICI